jgi:hypothetical protein
VGLYREFKGELRMTTRHLKPSGYGMVMVFAAPGYMEDVEAVG